MAKGSNNTRRSGANTRSRTASHYDFKDEEYIRDKSTIANFGKAGTYTLYRAGGMESSTSALFFATSFSYADTYSRNTLDKDGNVIVRPTNEYKVEIHNPLIIDSVTNQGCTSEAYAKLVGGKQPSSQLAKDKRIAAALKKSQYDAILYTINGSPHEVIVPKRGSSITPTGRKLTSTPFTRSGYSGKNDFINSLARTYMTWKNSDGSREYTREKAYERAIKEANEWERKG